MLSSHSRSGGFSRHLALFHFLTFPREDGLKLSYYLDFIFLIHWLISQPKLPKNPFTFPNCFIPHPPFKNEKKFFGEVQKKRDGDRKENEREHEVNKLVYN